MRIGKSFWIFVGGGFVGACAMIFLISVFEILIAIYPKEPSPPKIAGHKVPSETYKIDFSKRYDLRLSSNYGLQTYANCLIKGFTYEKREGSRGYSYFDTWLVVELPDQRLAYLPPRSIEVIEEAKP
ncbi:MAG: hypothetical protein ACYSSO_14005 [Planctomycetota bacterium]|jgi:hypothetical protein